MIKSVGTLMGVNVVVTPNAMAREEPKAPRTGDMRAMIDDLEMNGVLPIVRDVPAAFMIAGNLACHPAIYERMMRDLARQTERDIEALVFGAIK